MRSGKYIRQITTMGMLVALAMVLGFVETLIPINLGIPGMKLGLANIVVVIALFLFDVKTAVVVSILRIILIAMTFGNMSMMFYSIAGASLSLLSMIAISKIKSFSLISVSIVGGIMHNVGQIICAAFVVRTNGVFTYLPVLMIAGLVSGALIGIVAGLISVRLTNVKIG
ncbi:MULTISPECIES: Gx transporter family protein [Lachnoanaerobaculum]|jgi:heptaprenyl diphosphate synthase component I|uniref:Heptaprenyl diphosphate synthase component I n=2 Tax=Lachnoanaerobaculum TaxID=1164882 RepID=A0A133ZPP0_9FIRM|nr:MULTISPECIES: Gx transporter family protein [Lachnoanaerobaculum]KXB57415.1 heptaprenyl diphosphate synthase component I [Lachnoanaerobaculum saburreum]MBS6728829.1 Gx transporter family protein [Lachnospiraceae bacterium oral taxon 082]MBS6930240.1 Gx transporter family protein [Lachnospiraceae bacterium oral taxon 082]RRJ16441.1 Gx transporter family protein [Lachnoanaerobaculum orale]